MDKRHLLLFFLMLISAITRLIPHPPNFTPIIAIALFSGIKCKNKSLALLLPLLAMFLSDMVIGFHSSMIWVYSSILVITICSTYFTSSLKNIFGGVLSGCVLFFIVTNFGVWISSAMYTKDIVGLANCFIAAVPFAQNSIIGNLFYSVIMFSLFGLIERKIIKIPNFSI